MTESSEVHIGSRHDRLILVDPAATPSAVTGSGSVSAVTLKCVVRVAVSRVGLLASVTRTDTTTSPDVVGVPVSDPVEESDSPVGKPSGPTDHTNGALPPRTVSAVEYGTFKVAAGSVTLVTERVGDGVGDDAGVGATVAVGAGVGVTVAVDVGFGVGVRMGNVGDGDGLVVGVVDGVAVGVGETVGVGDGVRVGVADALTAGVGDAVRVGLDVREGMGVGVIVGVTVKVAAIPVWPSPLSRVVMPPHLAAAKPPTCAHPA